MHQETFQGLQKRLQFYKKLLIVVYNHTTKLANTKYKNYLYRSTIY